MFHQRSWVVLGTEQTQKVGINDEDEDSGIRSSIVRIEKRHTSHSFSSITQPQRRNFVDLYGLYTIVGPVPALINRVVILTLETSNA